MILILPPFFFPSSSQFHDQQPPSDSSGPSVSDLPILPDIRRSNWSRHKPSYLADYNCSMSATSHYTSPYTLASVMSYDHLSPMQNSFVLNVGFIDEPQR